jgi:arylsulfatase A-like enzyme
MKQFSIFRKSLYIIIGIVSIIIFTTCSSKNLQKNVPNIVIFLVDDMGWQDTSVPFWYQETEFNKIYHTPNMDRLADQGMKFTQAYSCAVCSPSRVSLLSGMNAARHRVTNWTLRKNESSDYKSEDLIFPNWNVNGISPVSDIENTIHITPLSQILQNNGYFTIHCGKAHFGAIGTPGEDPSNLGFNINISGHAAGAPGSYHGQDNFGNDENGHPKSVWSIPDLEKYHNKNINLTEALTREAIIAMDSSQNFQKPFFLYMAHYAVHTPIMEDKRFIQKYMNRGMNEIEAKYASMIESMDKSLGDIMDYLEIHNLSENTIILFTSDNGGLSAVARGGEPHTHNKPLSSGKGSAHEGGIREPMIVKWSGVVNEQSTTEEYIIIEDFFPTILEMAQINTYETIQDIDGLSFVPILKQETRSTNERNLIWHFPNNWGPTGPGIGASSTIRKGDWKLIYYHKEESFELFNLNNDIGETVNQSEVYPEKLNELANELSYYLRSVDAQMPIHKQSGLKVVFPDKAINQ